VTIKERNGRGRVEISFFSGEERERVLEELEAERKLGQPNCETQKIECAFQAGRYREVARLAKEGDPWAGGVGEELDRKSPTACKVTLAALARGAGESLGESLERELVMSARFLASHDFCEGVRAALVDRDRAPCWQPTASTGRAAAAARCALT